jgi:hypothetical protein
VIATRYGGIVLALLALTLVPTVIHSYVGATIDDGRTTAVISTMLAGYTAASGDLGERDETWGQRRFESTDWIERRYRATDDEVTLTVVRSYDLKTLYHHPELAITNRDLPRYTVEHWFGDDMPIHVLQGPAPGDPLGLYVLEYGGRFIERPILFQLRAAGELLVSGRRAMTLVFVLDATTNGDTPPESSGAAQVLRAAVESFTP